jgi:hypothetical protein
MRPLLAVASAPILVLALATAGAVAVEVPAYAATCSQGYLPLPDPSCQPGTTNPDVTQSTIGSTICVSGWTATVRPSSSYTTTLKIQQIAEYGYSDTSTADYEEDHLIPLELGGAPKAATNLWPEPRSGTKTAANKDTVENKLKTAVCNGTVTLAQARHAIATNWTTALTTLGLS